MKRFALFLSLLFALQLRAGAPNAEMPEAHIDAVEQTAAGWIATLTGPIEIVVAEADDPSRVRRTRLFAYKARVHVPVGNQLYARSAKGSLLYEQRLKSAVGSDVFVQMWGASLVIEGGRVVSITAGDVSFLRPTAEEAAFDIGRLPEIEKK